MDVHLREVTDADLPIFFAQQADPESVAAAAVPARDADAFAAHWAKSRADAAIVLRTIVAGGATAGHVLSFVKDGRRMVGYWLGREHFGRGVATRALTLLLGELTERPLYATVAAHNRPAARVLEKCGFVLREEMPFEDGVPGLLFALT